MTLDKLQSYLDSFSPKGFAAFAALASLLVVLLCFSPRFQVWHLPASLDTFETARASAYLAQCEDPLRRDVETAVRWRLLPPLVCHTLGLKGWGAFLIPWLGVWLLLVTTASIMTVAIGPPKAFLATIIISTTSAVLVPVGWLGMNDAWVWLALIGVAFGKSSWIPAIAGLLAPWVDERFIIGLPLALWVRTVNLGEGSWKHGLWCLPYLATRGIWTIVASDPASTGFVRTVVAASPQWLPFVPMAWWMALRLGWAVIGPSGVSLWRKDRKTCSIGICLMFMTLLASAVIAVDLSRSAAIVLPVLVWSIIEVTSKWSFRDLAVLAGAQLLIPAMHVVDKTSALITPLPVELYKLARQVWPALR